MSEAGSALFYLVFEVMLLSGEAFEGGYLEVYTFLDADRRTVQDTEASYQLLKRGLYPHTQAQTGSTRHTGDVQYGYLRQEDAVEDAESVVATVTERVVADRLNERNAVVIVMGEDEWKRRTVFTPAIASVRVQVWRMDARGNAQVGTI